MNAAEHLERHLGQMERGWASSSTPGVHVCLFRDTPSPGVATLATLGLSNTVLPLNSSRVVRQELLLGCRDDAQLEVLGNLLFFVADLMLTRKQALLRGDVIPLGDTIATDSKADSVYASIPVVYPDDLATLEDSTPPTVIVWLIPLLPAEAALVRSSGWSEFEDRLEAADPDLFDLCREGIG